jgi:hypothetical protein
MRKYQPIWEQIKQNKIGSLTAPTSSHARIINAVRKEKCKDQSFQLLTSESGNKYKLLEDIVEETITFTLKDMSL